MGNSSRNRHTYYVFGSAIEIVLLAGIVYYAWAWPKESGSLVDLL
jgi:hypothetical protein